MSGRIYGADHDDPNPCPLPHRTYVELVDGPLDGLLLDIHEWRTEEVDDGMALFTEFGRWPGDCALYAPRPGEPPHTRPGSELPLLLLWRHALTPAGTAAYGLPSASWAAVFAIHGRRVIVCSELKAGDRFDESRVKLPAGGDIIKARRMRQDFFSFVPTHKLFLLGNYRPEVGTGGLAFWRRMRLIPFERVVPDARKVDNLADILVREEGPGILTWLVDGARRYLCGEKDLTVPERVRVATTAYAETEDHMADSCPNAARSTRVCVPRKSTSTSPTPAGAKAKAHPRSPPAPSPAAYERPSACDPRRK